MKVEVSLSLNTFESFTYEFRGDPGSVSGGMRVLVPLRNRFSTGWIVGVGSPYLGKARPVLGIVRDDFIPDDKYLDFIFAVSREFMVSPGKLLDLSLSPEMRSSGSLFYMTAEGPRAVIRSSFKDLIIASEGKEIEIFYGKTGGPASIPMQKNPGILRTAGERSLFLGYRRSEFILSLSRSELSAGRSPLLLIPNNVSGEKYEKSLPGIRIYNSMKSPAERRRIWEMSRGSDPVFAGGGESAIFLPLNHPGAIIIEKPGSFFYDSNRTTGIDLRKTARIKASVMGVDLVEGESALTPFHFINRNMLHISDEREKRSVEIVIKPLNPGTGTIPDPIIDSIIGDHIEKRKVLVIAGKNLSFRMLICENCRKVFRCPSCGSSISVSDGPVVKCLSCSFEKSGIPACPECGGGLKMIEDISVSSFKKKLVLRAGEENVAVFESRKKKDPFEELMERSGNMIIITTPADINSIPERTFDSIFFIKPEAFFDLNRYNGGEQIFSFVSGLKELVESDGKISVYSVFHFHYAMKHINDEETFLARELKYREMFLLPPFFDLFFLEIKDTDIRKLAEKMRMIYFEYKNSLNIKKVFLSSRKRKRGFFCGTMELHSDSSKIADSGILRNASVTVRNISRF